MQKVLDGETDQHVWIEEFKKHKGISDLSRHDVVSLIDRIEVIDDKHIDVRFRFAEEYEKLQSIIEELMSEKKEAI